ncbi:MAG: large conductance mechanosensitive channel protein MscL [Microbacteriaceae bacterium]
MIKGFKEFLLRGNVIDLAVAVVIGAAFTAIVNVLIDSLFNPLIGALFQADSLNSAFILEIPLIAGVAELKFGAVLAAIIQFVLTAAVVYFAFVYPLNALHKRIDAKKGTPEAEVVPANELDLLIEIRDLLAAQKK